MSVITTEFVAVARVEQVPDDGRVRCFDVAGRKVALTRYRGEVVATAPSCPHQLAPLDSEGEVEGAELICFRHGWAFDLRTGECDADPDMKLELYPVRVDGDTVWVAVP